MLSSADDKATEASKRQDIFPYFKSALDYFHLHNLEHIYKRYTVKKFKVFVAVNQIVELNEPLDSPSKKALP